MNTKDQNGLTEKEFLRLYNPDAFDRLSITVDAVVFSVDTTIQTKNYRKLDDQKITVLLVKRKEHPYIGKWSLPGGFVGGGETLDNAAKRVIKDKTGLIDVYLEQLAVSGDPDRDPRMRIVSCAYLALLDRSKYKIKESALVADSAWFEFELNEKEISLTNGGEEIVIPFIKSEARNGKITVYHYNAVYGGLAFDHGNILLRAIISLREQANNTDIVFNLLPNEFSVTQLQQIYEIILGEKLLAPAFRRKIASKIRETGRFSQEKGHRPSQFYVYKGGFDNERQGTENRGGATDAESL